MMYKVLIAEDDVNLQDLFRVLLKKYKDKFEIILANDGEEAIQILEQEDVSVLVTDLQMPKVDGLTLLAYMNDKHYDIPCIVMTGHATPELEEKTANNTPRFIRKPFQIKKLVQAIIETLESDVLEGSSRRISIASFLQMVQIEQKTCLLEIAPPNDEKGHFCIKNGELYDAVFRDLEGEAAASEMIILDGASVCFRNLPKTNIANRINKNHRDLIGDAMNLKHRSDGFRI